eukprot:355827-Chlamydomonas_euryale.AAC.4
MRGWLNAWSLHRRSDDAPHGHEGACSPHMHAETSCMQRRRHARRRILPPAPPPTLLSQRALPCSPPSRTDLLTHCRRVACAGRFNSDKPDPHTYLLKGDGAKIKTTGTITAAPAPPKAGAFKRRANPPNTAFRRFYERGDLPIAVDHRGSKNVIAWK